MDTTVLLVDDHAMFRSGLRLLIEKEFDLKVVGEAGDGQTAITLVEDLAPDVVVMDISLPDLSGIEATRQILAGHPGTKILALSIHGGKRFVDGMLEAGAEGYLLKESAPEELIDAIQAVQRGEVYMSGAITEVVVAGYKETLSGEKTTAEQVGKISATPILVTKLFKPPITPDLVQRAQLIERIERNRQRPLTLISAPAGYGKSVLASSWLESCDCPSAWLSLDKEDNNLRIFLSYLLSAVRSTFPSIELKTQDLLEAPDLPNVLTLAHYLLNDLDQIEEGFILVIDDIHRIEEPAIYNLLTELLKHPSPNMHLVLVGRRDPPLPIASLRARQQVTEIGLNDLRFSATETSLLLGKMLDREIQESTAAEWTEKTEGWVTALRLAALSLRNRDWDDDLTIGIETESKYLQEYLLAEVLAHLSRDNQDWLLKISTQDRFCASLCEAVGQVGSDSGTDNSSGKEFIHWLRSTNLFLIPLDERGEWFRFHHLFQEQLNAWLKDQLTEDEVSGLHSLASTWFAENDLIDEAIQHALLADDISSAMQLVEQHRDEMMNNERWIRLDGWLEKLPPESIKKNPKLLITQAWSGMLFHSQYHQWLNTPDQVTDLLSRVSIASDEKMMISAESNALRTTMLYSTGKVDLAIEYAERVLGTLHPDSKSMYGQTAVILAMAYQAKGNFDQAIKLIQNTIDNCSFSDDLLRAKMLMGLCVVNWLEGKLLRIRQSAIKLLKLAEESRLNESISFGRYFLGCFHYIRNELTEAEAHFTAVIENRYLARQHYYAQCAFGLASCYVAQGNNNQARQEVETVIEYTFKTNNTWLREIANVFCTELDLRLNQGIEAFNWTKVADQSFFAPMYVFYMPKLTAVRAMLASNTTESLKTATSLLEHLHDITVSTHNIRIQIDVLALQALLHDVQGEQTAAFEKLIESLALAEPGGFIRNYVDLGPKMADLLTQLQSQVIAEQSQTSAYISRVLAAFPEADRAAPPGEPTSIGSADLPNQTGLSEPLTKRELQTLKYLATDLSPQEIATEIYVATATVRTHTKNIYSKLNVHSRLQAVRRAKDLGLL